MSALVDSNVPSSSKNVLERRMGDSELSYYLPARADGVNDMYLHLGFRAPEQLVSRERVRLAWAIMRCRHPLLAASVHMDGYDDVRFVYGPPESVDDVLADAESSLEFRKQSKQQLIDTYLNGPRTLSNERVSYLILSRSEVDETPMSPGLEYDFENLPHQERLPEWNILICAAHFLGDGMALHAFANDFFTLLGKDSGSLDLSAILSEEFASRKEISSPIPLKLEDRLPPLTPGFQTAAASVDFQLDQARLVGGQALPRTHSSTRHTVVPTIPFSEKQTQSILRKCKKHGVSISAALFALCNIAWSRSLDKADRKCPTMMYSALNLRPYLLPPPSGTDSYWFLAVGYFNVVLPSLIGGDEHTLFWHRACSAKTQAAKAAKSPLLVHRAHQMSKERGERARCWAKEDDDAAAGRPPSPPSKPASTIPAPESVLPARAKVPSSALIGLSLLGNLDAIYKHAQFPEIKMHTLTTGSRQRKGGMLLFGYTFAGRLWLSLGYDENGFETTTLSNFWEGVLKGVHEFLVD